MTNKTVLSDAQIFDIFDCHCAETREVVNTYELHAVVRAAEQAVLQSPEIQQRSWQPVETAPKDGAVVDLWADGERIPDMRWHATSPKFPSGYWCSADGKHWTAAERIDATHWMLPPSPPVDAAMEVKP